ncbi:MAG: hypothetical protein WC007_08280 [Pelobacteraceae bacterium]
MFKKIELYDQAEELGDIIEKLAAIAASMREAFAHQQSRFLEDVDNQYLELNEEIAFDAVMAEEQTFGKPLYYKEPIFRYEDILTHLQMIDKTLKQVADALRNQMRDGILFTGMEAEEINMLMERQESILHAIAEVVRNCDDNHLKEVNNECRAVADSCLKFATSCESPLVEGLCTPESAPTLLTILSRMQTLARNEVETLKLLSAWIWDRVVNGTSVNTAGHPSY